MPDPLPLDAPTVDRLELADPVFISDLHLSPATAATTAGFVRFCTDVAPGYRELLILGDLFEYWAGDDDSASEIGRRVAASLRAVSSAGTRVFLMHGNRDLLIGAGYAGECGANLLADPVRAYRAGRTGEAPILLAHGDRYCTLDIGYQRFRAKAHDRAFQQQFLSQPLPVRHHLIGSVRAQSEAGKREKDMTIMDVTPEAVAADLAAAGGTTMIHGHTHRPGHYPLDHARSRWVLPDWDLDAAPPRGGFLDWRAEAWALQPLR